MSIHKNCKFKTKNIKGTGDFTLSFNDKIVGALIREADSTYYQIIIKGIVVGREGILPSCLQFLEDNENQLDLD